MAGKLSGSPQEKLFKEYMTLVGDSEKQQSTLDGDSEKQQSVIDAIDAVCAKIAPPDFMEATEENALEVLNVFAIKSHSKDEFIDNLFRMPAINSLRKALPKEKKRALKEACSKYFKFVDSHSTEESLAFYMVGRHRLGYEYLARYWAALLFEQIIVRKVKLQDPTFFEEMKKKPGRNGRVPDLDECINFLSEEELKRDSIYRHDDVFMRYHTDKQYEYFYISSNNIADTRKRLLNFKQLRNDIMHDVKFPERMPGNNLEFVYYVWSELLPEIFTKRKNMGHDEKYSSIIDTISELEADYWIRYVEETAKANVEISEFKPIIESDFENLFLMRKKMLSLRGIFNKWKLLKKNGLTTDVVSTIDTTSAYIWMPLVPHTLKVAKKQGVYNCAVSILVTPLDFRVYMDFGGYAKDERERYYQFLKSPEYCAYVKTFTGTGKEEMKVFDIDWFSFITKLSKFEPPTNINTSTIESAKLKLKQSTPPITWNRMLHGYIINKCELPRVGIGIYWIEERLKWIITFYQAFKAFELKLLEQKKG